MRLLVVQHQDHLPPGLIAEWALDAGLEVDVVRPAACELPSGRDYDAAILLGQDLRQAEQLHPWVHREFEWLLGLVEEVPVLGVGSGSHLLALVLGGHVRRAAPWVGYASAFVASQTFIPVGPWLHWQQHAITPPPGSRLLARSTRGVLAFGSGRHVGVQFHPEATPWMVDWWCEDRALRPEVSPGVLRIAAREHLDAGERAGRALFDGFLEQAVGVRAPR